MKKLIKTVAVLMAAALAVGSLASCKMQAELGDSWKSWKKQDKYEEKDTIKGTADNYQNPHAVTLRADNADIDWWCWTDEKGQILTDTYNPSNRTIAKGSEKTFVFPDNETYKLVIWQKNGKVQAENADEINKIKGGIQFSEADHKSFRDFRGKVSPHSKYGKLILASNYGQHVTQQAEFWFSNNEPQDNSFFADGDYTVTEVWVLEQKESDIATHGSTPNIDDTNKNKEGKDHRGSQYTARQDLKYTGLSIAGKKTPEKADKVGFLVPAVNKKGETQQVIVALEQPNRAKNGADKKLYYFIDKNNKLEMYDGIDSNTKKPKVVKTVENFADDTVPFNFEFGGKTYKSEEDFEKVKISSSQLSEKKQEYWGARVTIEPHQNNKSSNLLSKSMGNVKFDRSGISDSFTNLNGRNALGVETFIVMPANPSEK